MVFVASSSQFEPDSSTIDSSLLKHFTALGRGFPDGRKLPAVTGRAFTVDRTISVRLPTEITALVVTLKRSDFNGV